MLKKNLVVLSGAGISAESGIKTFRDSDGLWENFKIEEIASPEGFINDPKKVLDFYNARRKQLSQVEPNEAHIILKELEEYFNVSIITQNIDDLHERAGSRNVIHLHGELKKARSVNSELKIIHWEKDLNVGDFDENGFQLRPHIVWFGELVPEMDRAQEVVESAEILLIIGTSMQVYPAAGLIEFVKNDCEIFVIDPNLENKYVKKENFFQTTASEGMKILKKILLESAGSCE